MVIKVRLIQTIQHRETFAQRVFQTANSSFPFLTVSKIKFQNKMIQTNFKNTQFQKIPFNMYNSKYIFQSWIDGHTETKKKTKNEITNQSTKLSSTILYHYAIYRVEIAGGGGTGLMGRPRDSCGGGGTGLNNADGGGGCIPGGGCSAGGGGGRTPGPVRICEIGGGGGGGGMGATGLFDSTLYANCKKNCLVSWFQWVQNFCSDLSTSLLGTWWMKNRLAREKLENVTYTGVQYLS